MHAEGFLRRESPTCERQFKWWPTFPPEEDAEEVQEPPDVYYCPYCHEPADPEAWWTKEQLEYAQELAAAEVFEPELCCFKNDMERSNRRSRRLIRFDVSLPPLSKPEPLTELDDMVRVDVPCHPEEPTKVDEGWDGEVACLVCGIRYPVDLVRMLPEEDVVARHADELGVAPESATREAYRGSHLQDVIVGAIHELENEGLLTVPMKVTGPWELRPTSDDRRRVAGWREEWQRRQSRKDLEVQHAILSELQRQWRADPEMHKLRSQIDVERFCEENDIERGVYLANAHRLMDQGKVGKQRLDVAGPDSGII